MASKTRAFGTHLLGSVLLASVVVFIVFVVWYPFPLYRIAGVSTVVTVLLVVDVIIGPLLTALVYREGKKLLWLDVSLIVVVQLSAFVFGFYSIYVARPAWIVFTGYRFDLVQVNELDERFLREAPTSYRQPSLWGPRWVAAHMPLDVQKRNQLIFDSLNGKSDMPRRPDLFVPLEQEFAKLRSKATPLSELERVRGHMAIRELKRRWPDADGYFPLVARSGHYVVIVDSATPRVLGVAELQPVE